MNDSKATIYWSKMYAGTDGLSVDSSEPDILYKNLIKEKNLKTKKLSLFNCPAVTDRMKTSFVFFNDLDTEVSYDFSDEDNPKIVNLFGNEATALKMSSFVDGAYLGFRDMWVFFCEEPITALINTPMLHKPTDFSTSGMFPPAKMDIGKWFRPITSEIQLWEKSGTLKINKGDPLFYLELITNKAVELKRFNMTENLKDIMMSCINDPRISGTNKTLAERYVKFLSSKKDKRVIKEIKENLVNE